MPDGGLYVGLTVFGGNVNKFEGGVGLAVGGGLPSHEIGVALQYFSLVYKSIVEVHRYIR